MKLKLTNPQIDAMLEDQGAEADTGNKFGSVVHLCKLVVEQRDAALTARDAALADATLFKTRNSELLERVDSLLDQVTALKKGIHDQELMIERKNSDIVDLRLSRDRALDERDAARETLATSIRNREAERDAARARHQGLEAANTNQAARIAQLEDANAALSNGTSYRAPDATTYIQKARRALANAERVIQESTPPPPTFKVGDSVSFNGSFLAYSVFEVRDSGCYTIISDRGTKRIVGGDVLRLHPGYGQAPAAPEGGSSVGTEVTLEDALPDAKIRNAQRESTAAYLRAMADMVVDGNGAGALRTTLRRWAAVLRGETSSQTIDSTGGSCDHCGITWTISNA